MKGLVGDKAWKTEWGFSMDYPAAKIRHLEFGHKKRVADLF